MKYLYLIVLLGMLSNLGCSSVARLHTADSQSPYSPTNAKKIKIYSTTKADNEYIIIGPVIANADAGNKSDVAVQLLKIQASKLGADAIVNMKLSISMGYWMTGINATGTDVKYKE